VSRAAVRAAGGIPWRVDPERGLEVLLVHRPRYDDWSFPKGKCEPGESDEHCALREVQEETGLRGVLGRELPHCEYIDGKGRFKVVRYWEMTVTDGGRFRPNDEVDEVRWEPLPRAARLLSYERDRRVLERFAVFAGTD
jgi:8-oxo-dGTP diphosphatase